MEWPSPPAKRRKISPPMQPHADRDDTAFFDADFSRSAASWDLERDYERKLFAKRKEKKREKLPSKTIEGRLERHEVSAEETDDSSSRETEVDTPLTEPSDHDNAVVAVSKQSAPQQILDAKEELARVASLINEDPEEHVSSLKTLRDITSSNIAEITRLGLVTQLAVFKDIIPGYRIRPITEEESKAKISKDVRKQRNFEQSIVRSYQTYVKELKQIATMKASDEKEQASLVDVAIGCACNLLQSVAHFNFRGELLTILVTKVSTKTLNKNFSRCAESLAYLFENDEDGAASLEAVSILSKMIKGKNFQVHEDALNVLLHLRLLSEFSRSSTDTNDTQGQDNSEKPGKIAKKHRQHWSKKDRKLAKERKAIEKEMKQADAVVGHEERDKNQAETLKLVLGVYFRILKARSPKLMGATLEGLVKFAHLINQELFGDILEALRDLVQNFQEDHDKDDDNENYEVPENSDQGGKDPQSDARGTLLCIITAFGLLQGQDMSKSASSLGLDLSFFVEHLYRILYPTALNLNIEKSSNTLQVRDPDSSSEQNSSKLKINVSTSVVLLLRSLRAALLPANSRNVPSARLAAFVKQTMTSSLHVPEKSSTALLGLNNDVVKTHRGKITSLWNTEERKGDGVFNAIRGDLEASNPFASTVWEGELLHQHYCPQVRDGARNLYSVLEST